MNEPKICPTCLTSMKLLPLGGSYCPNGNCAGDGDALEAPRRDTQPIGVPMTLDCGACGSSDIGPFDVGGIDRKHCWDCGAIGAREAVHS